LLEGKIIQQAVVTILNQIYEVDFNGFLSWLRPGHGPDLRGTRQGWASKGSR